MERPLLIVSFPKSGRTWLRIMLDDLGVGGRIGFTHDGAGHRAPLREGAHHADKSTYNRASVRLLLVRDPRDTAVSNYFEVTHRAKLSDASISEVLRDERHGIKKICHFNLQWFAAGRRMKPFAILSYEQIHKAPAEALCAVAALAGVTVDIRMAEAIAANRTFARLHAAEASGELAHSYGTHLLPADRNDAESFKVRRGVIGGYSDYLSEADLAYCDAVLTETDYWSHYHQAMSRWGLKRLRSLPVDHNRSRGVHNQLGSRA